MQNRRQIQGKMQLKTTSNIILYCFCEEFAGRKSEHPSCIQINPQIECEHSKSSSQSCAVAKMIFNGWQHKECLK